jgi:MFS family permease
MPIEHKAGQYEGGVGNAALPPDAAGAVRGGSEHFPFFLFLVIAAGEMATTLELSMILVALPKVIAAYGSPTSAYLVITVYFLIAASSVTLSSRLGDLFGRRRVLLVLLSVSVVGSIVSGLAWSLPILLIGRAITGVVSASLPLSFGLIRQHFPRRHLAMGIGLATGVQGIGVGVFSLVGGILVDRYPWGLIFWISGIFVSVSAVLVFLVVPRDKPQARGGKVDWLGGLLTVPAVGGLLVTTNLGRSLGWTNPIPLMVLAASLVLLTIWAVYEFRHHAPLVNVRLLAQRKLAFANIAMALLAMAPFQITGALSLRLQQPTWQSAGFGLSATGVGFLFLPLSLVGLMAGLLTGWIAARHGGRQAALIGAAMGAATWFTVALYHDSLLIFMGLIYITAMSTSLIYCAIPVIVVEASPTDQTSGITGVTAAVRLLVTGVGGQIVALILSWRPMSSPDGHQHLTSDAAFTALFYFFALSSIVIGVCIWAIPPKPEEGGGHLPQRSGG